MNNIPTSAVLDAAADAIQMGKWAQGWLRPPGTMCLVDGIAAATDLEGIGFDFACSAVREYLSTARPIYEWNDEPGRTKQEVIEVLRAAAAVERVKEATASAGYDTEDQELPLEVAA